MYDPLFQPPLPTTGHYIVDVTDRRFKLLAVNWYGGSDELFVPGGLDVRPRTDIANLIRSLGFNSVRLPAFRFLNVDDLLLLSLQKEIQESLIRYFSDCKASGFCGILEAKPGSANLFRDQEIFVLKND
jgi:hypothetical protein